MFYNEIIKTNMLVHNRKCRKEAEMKKVLLEYHYA